MEWQPQSKPKPAIEGELMSKVCEIGTTPIESEFQTLYNEMQLDKYWIRFFVRPCCPAPSHEGACDMLDKLKGEVMSHDSFTEEQKEQLAATIESRKEWYGRSGLCRKKA